MYCNKSVTEEQVRRSSLSLKQHVQSRLDPMIDRLTVTDPGFRN